MGQTIEEKLKSADLSVTNITDGQFKIECNIYDDRAHYTERDKGLIERYYSLDKRKSNASALKLISKCRKLSKI